MKINPHLKKQIPLLFCLLLLLACTPLRTLAQHDHSITNIVPGLGTNCLVITNLTQFMSPLPVPLKARPVRTNALYHVPAAPWLTYTNVPEYDMPMRSIMHKFHPDLPAVEVWGYNGTYPGPTFDVQVNQPILVNWINNLPALYPIWNPANLNYHGVYDQSVRTTVHLHGGASLARYDGYPTNTFGVGEADQYFYGNWELGHTGQTLWYHDHAVGLTGNNVYAGLAGYYYLRNPSFETNLNLPSGNYEVPLVLQDRDIQTNCAPASLSQGASPWHSLAVVNGKVTPYLEVEPRKYRFRILNGAGARTFGLFLRTTDTNGLKNNTNVVPPQYTVIGTEDGFLKHATNLDSSTDGNGLFLMPGERIDVVIDFSKHAKTNLTVITKGANGNPSFAPKLTNLMQFRVTLPLSSPDTSAIPATNFVNDWVETATMFGQAVSTQTVQLDLNLPGLYAGPPFIPGGSYPFALLNLKFFSDPTTEMPHAGDTEVWNFVNLSSDAHPMHVHLLDFRIGDRIRFGGYFTNANGGIDLTKVPTMVTQYNKDRTNGVLKDISYYLSNNPDDNFPIQPFEDGPKDTVRVGPYTLTQVVMKWPTNSIYYSTASGSSLGDDTFGRYIYHCHILDHEDNDMMRPLTLLPPYQPPLMAVADATSRVKLQFPTRKHESYRIESTASLGWPNWQALPGGDVVGSGAAALVTPPSSADQTRYYRLKRISAP